MPAKSVATPVAAPPTKKAYTTLKAGANNQTDVIVPPKELLIKEIRDAIPDKYFKRDMSKGFFYVFRDIAQAVVTAGVMYKFGLPLLEATDEMGAAVSYTARFLLWNAFWFIQGLNWTGLWVMAHECGHQAFSDYRIVNDTVGWILHSFLLVPYHSWRITHGTHHKNTNHLTKDTVFIPPKHDHILTETLRESPLGSLWGIFLMLTIGWPAYLAMNIAGQDYGRLACHFQPSSPMFRPSDAADVVVSDVGILFTLLGVAAGIYNYGFMNVLCWYIAPYLWVNGWLVYITYLQHSDVRLPHYSADEWTFVRGGLCTIDRSFGKAIGWWLHHINDSHVVHHLFSQMPFYNAIQVTRKHCKEIFGDMYQADAEINMFGSLWESWRECRYVNVKEPIMVYRK